MAEANHIRGIYTEEFWDAVHFLERKGWEALPTSAYNYSTLNFVHANGRLFPGKKKVKTKGPDISEWDHLFVNAHIAFANYVKENPLLHEGIVSNSAKSN